MATSNGPDLANESPPARRAPLRLRMNDHVGRDHLDGGWWPQSRELDVELADLVDHFPSRFSRIVRARYSRPDWEPARRRLRVAGGSVKVGSRARDDTHVIRLKTHDRTVLHLLVVPPEFTAYQGDEALLAAATIGNAHPAGDLLNTVTEHPDVDPIDLWSDEDGSWWGPGGPAPSFRAGG